MVPGLKLNLNRPECGWWLTAEDSCSTGLVISLMDITVSSFFADAGRPGVMVRFVARIGGGGAEIASWAWKRVSAETLAGWRGDRVA